MKFTEKNWELMQQRTLPLLNFASNFQASNLLYLDTSNKIDSLEKV